jgi:AbrB family looped-hinge helix DNA binding protein
MQMLISNIMQYVSITSQGQITIPAKFRKLLGLNKATKAVVNIENNKLVIKPASSLMDLEGILEHKALKLPAQEIRKREKMAWTEALKDKYAPK